MTAQSTGSDVHENPHTETVPDVHATTDRLRSIVAGVDFSPGSRSALQQAIRVARRNRGKLWAIHVLDTVVVRDLEAALSPVQQRIHEGLIRDARGAWEAFIAELPRGDDVEMTFDVEIDNRISAMLRQVKKRAADLLVLGAHSSGDPDRGTGPLATACVRKAACNVLLVRDPHSGPFKVVVACVDFSDTSRRALEQAVRVAEQDASELHVLHVNRPPWQLLPFRAATLEVPGDVQQRHHERLRQELEEFARPVREQLRVAGAKFVVFDHNSYGPGIHEYARSVQADLVVLGTLGRSNLRYVLLGSTAERVVRNTPCSILAVKPQGFVFPPPSS